MKKNKIIYLGATGLLSAMMLMSAGMDFFQTDVMKGSFEALGFPTFIILPVAILKIAGIATIWINKWPLLVHLAYAGFFFQFLLAAGAHIAANDGQVGGALVAIALLITSYVFKGKVFQDTLSLSPVKA